MERPMGLPKRDTIYHSNLLVHDNLNDRHFPVEDTGGERMLTPASRPSPSADA